jgi:ATPase subunit of ABC transporter with duplicated ATPase domains
MKMIDKIEIPDVKKSSRISPQFNFTPIKPTGKTVLKVDGLSKTFKDKPLFQNVSFEVNRGERVAIMGANGVGKSTLIKILTDTLTADSGSFEWGHNIELSYFSQDHHDLLNTKISVLSWLSDVVSGVNEQKIRQALGQMYFTKDDVNKNILDLSGGEAARLLLAKVMLEKPNTLILDEPTNHMDIETIISLGNSLAKYTGTLIFVSHDRQFIDRVATRIIYVSHGEELMDYKGNYSDFSAQFLDK